MILQSYDLGGLVDKLCSPPKFYCRILSVFIGIPPKLFEL